MSKLHLSTFDPIGDHTYIGDNPLVSSLVPPNVALALDIGCGEGGIARRLSEERGLAIDGITWSPLEAQVASQFCRNVYVSDVSNGLPLNVTRGVYDCVICSHLLEHIAYPQTLLQDIHSVLKLNGSLLVAIPNIFFWPDRLKLFVGKWEYSSSGTFDYTHLRWYTQKSLIDLVEPFGYRLEIFVGDGWVPLPGLRFLIGAVLRKRINDIFAQKMPGIFAKQLVYKFLKI